MIKSRRMGWAGHIAWIGAVRNAYKISVGKYEGKKPCRRLRHGWEDNIRMNHREIW